MNGYMYKSGLGMMEPVATIGQYVAVHYLDAIYIRRVRFLEAIPPFQAVDVGAIAAQTVSARTAMNNLEMPDSEFGQFRWFPLDNVQVRLWLPQSQGKSILRNIMVPVDPTIVTRDPCLHLTEFYVWENNRPFVECINYSDYAVAMSRVVVMGYRFNVEPVAPDAARRKEIESAIMSGSQPATHVWCSGKQM